MARGELVLYWLNWDHPMTTGAVLGNLYWENWEHSGGSEMSLVELGRYWLNWDHSMTTGTMLGGLGYDHTGRNDRTG